MESAIREAGKQALSRLTALPLQCKIFGLGLSFPNSFFSRLDSPPFWDLV